MENIALLVEYDGRDFFGFQKQPGTRTVQGELELALSQIANHKVEVITAGRTDTGVHALYQVVNFTTMSTRNLYSWIRGINALLPLDIVVREAVPVELNFNARFSAHSRTYHYYLFNNPVRSSVLHKKVGWYYKDLDVSKMQQAGQLLLGIQDFSSFRASSCQAASPSRNVVSFKIVKHGDLIRFEITANAFLHHMVRNIVGALVYVGNGNISVDEFALLIKNRERKYAPPTFMPDGLYLAHVEYPTDIFSYKISDWLI